MEQDELEALIARRVPRGKGKYKGKLPLKCFSCNKIGHIAARCLDNKNTEKKNRFKNKAKECYLAEGVTNNESEDSEDEEIVFVAIKEESQVISEMTLISRSH